MWFWIDDNNEEDENYIKFVLEEKLFSRNRKLY